MTLHASLLSLREVQAMRLAAKGMTAKATAKALHISASAVNLYLTNARHKLGARTKSEAIAILLEAGPTFRESIEYLREQKGYATPEEERRFNERRQISRKLRDLLDDMSIVEVTQKVRNAEDPLWTELAEQFLHTAAEALGYGIVKQSAQPGTEVSRYPSIDPTTFVLMTSA